MVGGRGVGLKGCTSIAIRKGTHLLFRSQSFATKLANTLSACVLVIGDVNAFTSRSAAKEETENDLFGAIIICSTWGKRERG